MNVICPVVNRGPSIQCPCFDDPVANLSAEEPDVDVFIPNPPGPRPPDPKVYIGYGCAEWIFCASTISQEAADDCANQYDILCLEPPDVDPPIPPGPNGPTGPGTPGGIVPPSPRNPLPKYYNTEQSCTSECPNGQVFSSTVAAGTVVDLTSVSNANAKAAALACNRANKQKLCFANSPPGGCLGEPYEFDFEVVGNELADGGYFWTSFDLPPGLELNAFTGQVTGTPTVPGSYFVLVDVFGGNNSFNTNSFTICIMEIENASVLTDATIDQPYLEPLTQTPADVSSEVWTVVVGPLPPGITLASNGALSGTPTTVGTYAFTLRVAATCDGQSVTCQKDFILEVFACSLTCASAGSIAIPDDQTPNFTAYAASSGLIFGGGGGDGINPGVLHVIDPTTVSLISTVNYSADEGPEAGVYHPFTERLIVASSAAAGTLINVINPTSFATEDSIPMAPTGPHPLALDTVNNRVYIGYNNFITSQLWSFDVVSHVPTLIAVGSTNLGATAYSPDDDLIFCALDTGFISVFDALTFSLVATLTVGGGNAIEMAYCPTNRCLYAGHFPLSVIRVWKCNELTATTTNVNFIIPGVGGQVQVDIGSTVGMVVGRTVTIDLANYTIISVDSANLVTVENLDGVPTTLVLAGAPVSYEGIILITSIATPTPPFGVVYDSRFDRIIYANFAAQTVFTIDPATQLSDCGLLLGMEPNWTNLGNSGCKLFLATGDTSFDPDNGYHTLI